MDNPLMGMEPPTESIGPWWPLIGVGISVLIAAVSAIWAAWLQLRMAKSAREEKENEAKREQIFQQEQSKQAFELEQLKKEFEQRKDLVDTLQSQLKEQLEEGRKMRAELKAARDEVVSRDKSNRDEILARDNIILELRDRISHLEREMKNMEQEQASMRQAHSTGVTTP